MNAESTNDRDQRLAFAIFRLTLGVNIFLHGFVRLRSGVDVFATSLVTLFASTPLPAWSIRAFGQTLPFAEAGIGLLLMLGLRTRLALMAGGLLMTALVFGTALRSDWSALGIQMVYSLAYYLLLSHKSKDAYGLDALFTSRRPQPEHSSG